MADKTLSIVKLPPQTGSGTTLPVRRHPGHRGADIRNTVAEMAAKAHEISMEAGSKMAAAMKDVIGAAAGLSSFSIESARDLAQFMVRRSQMTQDEADKLIATADEATKHTRKKSSPKSAPGVARPAAKKPAAKKPAAKKPAAKKPAAKKPAAKKPAAKKPSVNKPAAKKPASKKKPVRKK